MSNKCIIFEVDENGFYVNPQEVIDYYRGRICELKGQLHELRRRRYYNKTHGKQK